MRTQLSYLDLEAFYLSAKSLRNFSQSDYVGGKSIADICDKLTCVIDAIRNDGLDPRWNPERDALRGIVITNSNADPCLDYRMILDDVGAKTLIDGLHERGYKIVKDTP